MVEAGWYFCPNEESDDFVSCAYCNLSLDGWEPQDDPFDEHYRRSSQCSFFHFAPIPGKKGKSGRRTTSRSSKASRISTQSATSSLSEPATADIDSEMEQSLLSLPPKEVLRTVAKGKSKGRKTKTKKDNALETSSQIDDNEPKAENAHSKKARGRKRKSHEMNGNEAPQGTMPYNVAQPEPAAKRRAIGARKASTAGTSVVPEVTDDELNVPVEAAKSEKPANKKAAKKRSTSTNRIPSTASKASLRSRVPDDTQLEAELEADLERHSVEDIQTTIGEIHEDRISERDHISSTASIAPTRVTKRIGPTSDLEDRANDVHKPGRKKAQGKKTTKKTTIQTGNGGEMHDAPTHHERTPSATHMDLDNPEIRAPSEGRTDETHDVTKPPKKGKTTKKSRSKKADIEMKKSSDATTSRESIASNKSLTTSLNEPQEPAVDQKRKLSAQATDKSFSKELNGENVRQQRSKSQTSPIQEQILSDRTGPSPIHPITRPQTQEHTPSPSPQSSDAENRPPSTRPSINKNETSSKSQILRVPLAPSTPATSMQKRFGQSICLTTPNPWNPVDLDDLLQPDSANKENVDLNEMLHAAKGDLTSPEKRMSVEEWIAWNAKKGESRLRNECERLVSLFEREGGRAMRVLDEIECID
ncbi:hypothetical protein PRK78_000324 [Emydomyces testavorans]|uniref:Uncharacterized protein n=1 Tax=Emydomyces testavorans TaxID=2070801 RepID=A0AAF0IFH1_9EURO|nr:hypothetical protein PRK78_000324 [Emydomyces testavorans]